MCRGLGCSYRFCVSVAVGYFFVAVVFLAPWSFIGVPAAIVVTIVIIIAIVASIVVAVATTAARRICFGRYRAFFVGLFPSNCVSVGAAPMTSPLTVRFYPHN